MKPRSCPLPWIITLILLPLMGAAEPKGLIDASTASLFAGADPLKNLVVGVVSADHTFSCEYGTPLPRTDGGIEFDVASVTKPFTGVLLAKLVAERTLRYEDAVESCSVGATTSTCFKGEPITFLHLITHYSGLPATPPDHERIQTVAEFDQFLRSNYHLTRAPGSRFEYSTVGYALLGKVLTERAEARSFADLMQEKILGPLGLKRTRFRRADNYANPSGGLTSTVEDLLKFVSLNINPAAAGEFGEAIRLTHISDPKLNSIPPSIAARGWHVIQPLGYYWHSGVATRSRSFIAFDLKTKKGVVLLTKSAIAGNDSRLEMAGFSILGGLAASP